jgi:hypothetical protein
MPGEYLMAGCYRFVPNTGALGFVQNATPSRTPTMEYTRVLGCQALGVAFVFSVRIN